MAKATFIKAARKAIYVKGKMVEYVSQKGKRAGQTVTKIDRTVPHEDGDQILIAKGESYYTWGFMYGGTYYSKTAPRPSQLTSSAFLQTYYGIQEQLEDWSPSEVSELEGFVDDLKTQLEELRDETQEKLDNMPEQLQEADTGQLLQERIESLEETISELENLDELQYDEPDETDVLEQIAEDEGIDTENEGWKEAIDEDMISSKRSELEEQWLEEKRDEIKGVEFNL